MFCVTFLVKWDGAYYTKDVISNPDSLVPWCTKNYKKAVKFIRLQVASIIPRLFLIEEKVATRAERGNEPGGNAR